MGKRDFLEQYILKNIKVIFDDGNHITYKNGMLSGFDENFLYLSIDQQTEAVSIDKVVRIEFLEGEK